MFLHFRTHFPTKTPHSTPRSMLHAPRSRSGSTSEPGSPNHQTSTRLCLVYTWILFPWSDRIRPALFFFKLFFVPLSDTRQTGESRPWWTGTGALHIEGGFLQGRWQGDERVLLDMFVGREWYKVHIYLYWFWVTYIPVDVMWSMTIYAVAWRFFNTFNCNPRCAT